MNPDRRHSRHAWMLREATPQLCLALVLVAVACCWLLFRQGA